MTNEELAEEYIQNGDVFDNNKVTIKSVEQAFIAGLKAGRTKWHNLKKNPEDLPKDSDYEKLYLIHWGKNEYGVAQFNDGRWWSFDSGLFNVEEVIAWCELLEFIECRT